jgi:2-dehydro-3-deoxyphosphogluconate aldolase/(4S)-4-hydroxy-2-oxoglutarate aldolase
MMRLSDPTTLLTAPVVPVLTIEHAADAPALARALLAGGLPAIEVTLRTREAFDAVRAIVAEVPDVIVGVGTVTEAVDIRRALEAGAEFLVSPGTPSELAAALADAPVPVLPGCATVGEAMALAALGFPVLKFFPAEASGGVRWLTAVREPLPDVKFCPTGGVNAENAAAYLALRNVVAVGGSWVAPPEVIAARDFARITALARVAAGLVRTA